MTTSTKCQAALDAHRRGWRPIPVRNRSKAPAADGWQKLRLNEDQIRATFGNGRELNLGVLLGPVSDGLTDVDLDCSEAISIADLFLIETKAAFGRPSKPRSHWLYRIDPEDWDQAKKITFTDPLSSRKARTLLELRWNGQQTVLPPSIHESSEQIEWVQEGDPATVGFEAIRTAVSRLAAAALLGRYWPEEGLRHWVALDLAGGLLRADWLIEDVENFILAVCRAAGDEEAEDRIRAVQDTANKLEQDEKVTGWPSLAKRIGQEVIGTVTDWLGIVARQGGIFTNNDSGNAERLVFRHSDRIRNCPPWGKWLVWDGRRWAIDERGEVVQLAKETVRSIHAEAAAIEDDDVRARLVKWAFASGNAAKLSAMIRLAQSEPDVVVMPDDLDVSPWLLNLPNGTLNLLTRELKPHDPDDLITKLAPVRYEPNAVCPLWESYLDYFLGREDTEVKQALIGFIQRAFGYTLTGETNEKALFMPYGTTDTGKTTLVNTLMGILGPDYATPLTEKAIRANQYEDIPNEVAALKGARLAVVSETSEGMKLNVARIKAMTGQNRISARFLFREFFSFTVTHTLWVETNHRPHASGGDDATWNRIKLIPFNRRLPKERQDREFGEKLREEYPGILAWAVRGCLDGQQNGLQEPDEVRMATESYREDMDVLGRFLREALIEDKTAEVQSSALYGAYKGWVERNGERALASNDFAVSLKEQHGMVIKRTKKARLYRGWRLALPELEDGASPFGRPKGR